MPFGILVAFISKPFLSFLCSHNSFSLYYPHPSAERHKQPFPACGEAITDTPAKMIGQQEVLISLSSSSSSPYPSGDFCISAPRQKLPVPPHTLPQSPVLRPNATGMASTKPDRASRCLSMAPSEGYAVASWNRKW